MCRSGKGLKALLAFLVCVMGEAGMPNVPENEGKVSVLGFYLLLYSLFLSCIVRIIYDALDNLFCFLNYPNILLGSTFNNFSLNVFQNVIFSNKFFYK